VAEVAAPAITWQQTNDVTFPGPFCFDGASGETGAPGATEQETDERRLQGGCGASPEPYVPIWRILPVKKPRIDRVERFLSWLAVALRRN